jgi:cell wall-associated NlpC family hydrolase
MKKMALLGATALVGFVLMILSIVILFSTVGGTTQAAACEISSSYSSVASTPTATTSTTIISTPATNADCGASSSATLPTSPVINDGLPENYVIPANATTVETVALSYALAQLAKPYLWGASGPDAFDCSGLTMMAWAQAGVRLLHYTGDQINEGVAVPSYSDISPGDLVLVPGSDGTLSNPGHVGIYLGDGLVESAVDVHYGIIVQPYDVFVSGGLSGIRHVG